MQVQTELYLHGNPLLQHAAVSSDKRRRPFFCGAMDRTNANTSNKGKPVRVTWHCRPKNARTYTCDGVVFFSPEYEPQSHWVSHPLRCGAALHVTPLPSPLLAARLTCHELLFKDKKEKQFGQLGFGAWTSD